MRKVGLLFAFVLIGLLAFGQQREEAEKLVDEGVAYHDKGDYEGAIARYDKALRLDKDNLKALAEKAFTLCYTEKYDDAISVCREAIEKHPGEGDLVSVYVAYGTALDGLKRTDKAIEIYEEGIKRFPSSSLLHFNKGITLSSVKKYDDALLCFQQAVIINPRHASSHNAIARISFLQDKRIPSLLAYSRFMILEPNSGRAKDNLGTMLKTMSAGVTETGKSSITISLSPDMLADTLKDGKPKENSFRTTELILSLDAALDLDKKNKKKSEVEKFNRKFESICASLKESRKANHGFYWEYYAPYFIEMKDKNLLEPFAYIAFSSSGDADVAKWLKAHQGEVDKFYEWSKAFSWKAE